MMDINEIKKIIPHRYPFLLVDKIIECDMDSRIVGIKNVTANEPFFRDIFRSFLLCQVFLLSRPLRRLPVF